MSPFTPLYSARIRWGSIESTVSIVTFISVSSIFFTSSVLFWLRRSHRLLAIRSPLLTFTQATASVLATASFLIDYLVQDYPCFLSLWIINICVPIWITSLSLRILRVYTISHVIQADLLGQSKNGIGLLKTSKSSGSFATGLNIPFVTEALTQSRSTTGSFATGITSSSIAEEPIDGTAISGDCNTSEEKQKEKNNEEDDDISSIILEAASWKKRSTKTFAARIDDLVDKLFTKRSDVTLYQISITLGSVTAIMVINTIFVQVFTSTAKIYPTMDFGTCDNVVVQSQNLFLLIWVIVYLVFLSPFMMWMLYHTRESYFIVRETYMIILFGNPVVILYLVQVLSKNFSTAVAPLPAEFWAVLFFFVSHISSIVFPLSMSYREDKRLTSSKMKYDMASFKIVLEDTSMFESLKELAAADLSMENTLFYEAVKELTRQSYDICRAVHKPTRRSSYADQRRNTAATVGYVPYRVEDGRKTSSASYLQAKMPIKKSRNNRLAHSQNSTLANSASRNLEPTLPITIPECLVDKNTPIPTEMVSKYMRVYEVYIKEGAPREVNLSYKCRAALGKKASAVARGDAGVSWLIGDFDEALEWVVKAMFENLYPRWMDKTK